MKLLSGIIQTKLLSADYYAVQGDSKFESLWDEILRFINPNESN